MTNPVLTQLPRAQEAYVETVRNWEDVNTTDLLLFADKAIREQMGRGQLVAQLTGIQDVRVAEKAAIELADLGYHTQTCVTGQAPQADGSVRPLYGINVTWAYMPSNRRDAFTV